MTHPAQSPREPLYTKAYLMLAASSLLAMIAYGFFFIFPLFILHINGDKTDIGILMGVLPLSAVLCRPWISVQVDRIGRKKSYLIGCIIMMVAGFSYQFFMQPIDSVFCLHFALRLVHGVGFAFFMVASITFVTDLIPKSRYNEGFGMFGITGLTGMALGPLFAENIAHYWGFRGMFITATAICLFALIIALVIRENYTYMAARDSTPFFKMLRHPLLFRITLIGLSFGIGFSAHGSFVAPYAQSKGLLASLYFVAYSTAAICTRIAGGRMADRWGETHIIPVSIFVIAMGFLTLVRVHTPAGLLTSGFITGLGHGMVFPCLLSLAIRPVSPQNRGKASGVFTGGVDSGIFLGSLLLGMIGESLGYNAIFISAGACLLAGMFLFAFWRRRFARGSS